jgi:hypothetical protein
LAKRDKRLAAIRNNPRAVRFEDLRSVLEAAGFTGRRGKGDHWVFAHPAISNRLTIDPRRPYLLKVYVMQALAALDDVADAEGEDDEDDSDEEDEEEG